MPIPSRRSQITNTYLAIPISPETAAGTWTGTATGVLTFLACEGDPCTPVLGDTRAIALLRFAGREHGGSCDEDGQPCGLNAAGQITFALIFTDGSSGLFLIPRP